MKKKHNEVVVVYYYRNGESHHLDWETHLKLYLAGWEANPTGYILEKEFKKIKPNKALKQAIQQWAKTTDVDPTENGHHFSLMVSKTEDLYLGIKSVTGKKIAEYL